MKTRKIPLSRGHVALVDDQDYDRIIAAGPWHATTPTPSGNTYARHSRHDGGGKYAAVRMHHLVAGSEYVDHINGDGLDNRRANLRPAALHDGETPRTGRTLGYVKTGRKTPNRINPEILGHVLAWSPQTAEAAS